MKMATNKTDLIGVLRILQKYNLKETETLLRKEASLGDVDNIAKEFMEYQATVDDEPNRYEDKYLELVHFIESVLDMHKAELSTILYPVFVQMYLRLISGNMCSEGAKFMSRFRTLQDDFYQEDIKVLATVQKPEQMSANPLLEQFRSVNFVLSMSRESHNHLKRFLQERSLQVIHSVVTDQLDIEIFDGPPRSKLMIDSRRGAMFGESRRDINKTRVLYGLIKDIDVDGPAPSGGGSRSGGGNNSQGACGADPGNDDDGGASKKKKAKKDTGGPAGSKLVGGKNVGKQDNNAPAVDRIPLPELRDADKDFRRTKQTELAKRIHLGRNGGVAPSVCMYTVTNVTADGGVSSAAFSEDNNLLSVGLSSGRIQVHSLSSRGLSSLKEAEMLEQLDKSEPDVRQSMLYPDTPGTKEAPSVRFLVGHSGPVYDISYNPDNSLILSASADGSVRLWCSYTWSNVAAYRDHVLPVWCTRFSSTNGHYFVTGGGDRTARLWTTDHAQPLRLFVQHLSDVTSVDFHPNSNYIASGSSDRAVRLFDCLSGKLVRLFTGHKGSVESLAFSPDGRYLASGCWGGLISVWDIGNGHQVGQLQAEHPVISLAYCRDGNVLASGGMDCSLRFWDMDAFTLQHTSQRATVSSVYHSAVLHDQSDLFTLGVYRTKRTPVLAVHFTRRNLVLAAGPFNQV